MRLRHPNMVGPYVRCRTPFDDAGRSRSTAAAEDAGLELDRAVGIAPRPVWITISIRGRQLN
jgi:hypothetical protein